MSDVTEPWYAKHLRDHSMRVAAVETKLAEHEREIAAYRAHGEYFGRLTVAEGKADGLREALAILRR